LFYILFIFSHNNFYTGNCCELLTRSNLTLDHSILFPCFYNYLIEEFIEEQSNRFVVEVRVLEDLKIYSRLILFRFIIYRLYLYYYCMIYYMPINMPNIMNRIYLCMFNHINMSG